MTESIYHVRKFSLGLKRKYRLSADDGKGRPGPLIGFAEKQLKLADEIVLYADESRGRRVATVRESSVGFLAGLTGYEVFDADQRQLGAFGVVARKSIQRTTWSFDQPGLARITGSERSLRTARVRRLVGLGNGVAGQIVNAVGRYHFDFVEEGTPMFSIEKPKLLDDWYRLRVHDDRLDRTLLFALVVTMEARHRG